MFVDIDSRVFLRRFSRVSISLIFTFTFIEIETIFMKIWRKIICGGNNCKDRMKFPRALVLRRTRARRLKPRNLIWPALVS